MVDPKVRQSLSAMAQVLNQAETLLFSATATTEDVSSTLQKLQFDTTVRGIIHRPNLAFIEKTGAENTTLWYDGSTLVLLDRNVHTYIRLRVAGGLTGLLAKLDELKVETPFAGLISPDLQAKIAENVYQGDMYATTIINERPSTHLALRQENVDWQVWIDKEKNTPTKVVITSKLLAGAPSHTLVIKELSLNAPVEGSTFRAAIPLDAREAPVTQ